MSVYYDPNLSRQENERRHLLRNENFNTGMALVDTPPRIIQIDPNRNKENWARCIENLIPATCGIFCCPCATTRLIQHICGKENPEQTCKSFSPKICPQERYIYPGYTEIMEGDQCSDRAADMASVVSTVAAAVVIPLAILNII